jgi:prolipoprotein diacylglyceryltransferase
MVLIIFFILFTNERFELEIFRKNKHFHQLSYSKTLSSFFFLPLVFFFFFLCSAAAKKKRRKIAIVFEVETR